VGGTASAAYQNVETDWHPEDDSRLIQQALECLAVADLLIEAYPDAAVGAEPARRPGDCDLKAVEDGGLSG